MFEHFKEVYEGLRGHAHHAASWEEAANIVMQVVADISPDKTVLGPLPESLMSDLKTKLDGANSAYLEPPYLFEELPGRIDEAEVGVSWVDHAIVDSGTLLEIATNDSDRLISTLPRVHIGIVTRDRVIEHLMDSASIVKEAVMRNDQNCVVSFLSGPSRTGDIEMQLTLGVHGPEVAHAIIVDEEAPAHAH